LDTDFGYGMPAVELDRPDRAHGDVVDLHLGVGYEVCSGRQFHGDLVTLVPAALGTRQDQGVQTFERAPGTAQHHNAHERRCSHSEGPLLHRCPPDFWLARGFEPIPSIWFDVPPWTGP